MSSRSVHRIALTALLLIVRMRLFAFTPTGIATAFFGPNAFPVPDLSDGRTDSLLRVEIAADGYWGLDGSQTADLFARARVPLFTRWANLSLWMPVYEWYRQADGTGGGAGDVYISTDIQVLHNEWFKTDKARWIPQATIRAGLKTASGGQFERKRHFDGPGYFFDLAIGEDLCLSPVHIRLSGTIGFLCWQTTTGRQNDAILYGAQLLLRHEYVSLLTTFSGYTGWENHGDAPMTLAVRIAGHAKSFEPFVQYQYGLRDYPFHQLRIGMAYNISILHRKQAHP